MNENLPFAAWARWFEDFEDRQLPLPRPPGPELTRTEKRLIGPSIKQFQLGESSDAAHFLTGAGRYAATTGDISYPAAVRAFVREENRHAALLGRFMDQEGLPRARKHWMDGGFRVLRHRFGLRRSVTLLLCAEFIAVPYYTALREASSSTVLAAICKQILIDEETHIQFQSLALRALSRDLSPLRRKADDLFARSSLEIALDLVWFSHGRVLEAGGYDYSTYRQTCLDLLRRSRAMVHGQTPISDPFAAFAGKTLAHHHPASEMESLSTRPVTPGMFRPNNYLPS